MIDVSIVDRNNDKMGGRLMYKVQGKKGFFHKDQAGSADLSSAVIQFTKMFGNMKEALGENWSKNDVEMGQTFNKENAAKPLRDTFMLVLNSEVLDAESMGRFYTTCFDPQTVKFSIWGARSQDGNTLKTLDGDYTNCYIRNKMSSFLDQKCNGENQEATFEAAVLNSDENAICTA